LIQHVLDHT